MKAARLHEGSTTLEIEDITEPRLRPNSVIIRVESAFASLFISRIVDGSATFLSPPRPFTPGMDVIGVVEEVAPEVRGLTSGTRIYCSPRYEPLHSNARIFIGSFALGSPPAEDLLAVWPDGGYAEKMCLPADCAIPIPADVAVPPSILCRLGWLGTAYGALRKIGPAPGAVVAVHGAHGLAGSGAVAVALAMGASKVFAIGRRAEPLKAIAAIDDRVTPVIDVSSMPSVDVVLTAVNSADSSPLEALLPRLRRYGKLVVIGAPKAPLSLPVHWLLTNEITIRGSSWFERWHLEEMLRLIASRQLDLSVFDAEVFSLAQVNQALEAAKERPNPLRHVSVLCS